jgi:hypothetical protein
MKHTVVQQLETSDIIQLATPEILTVDENPPLQTDAQGIVSKKCRICFAEFFDDLSLQRHVVSFHTK